MFILGLMVLVLMVEKRMPGGIGGRETGTERRIAGGGQNPNAGSR